MSIEQLLRDQENKINELRSLLRHSLTRNHPITSACSACENMAKEAGVNIDDLRGVSQP